MMAPWLRAQTALAQGPSIFPSTHVKWITTTQGIQHPLLGSVGSYSYMNIPSYRCMHMNTVEIKYPTKKCTANG